MTESTNGNNLVTESTNGNNLVVTESTNGNNRIVTLSPLLVINNFVSRRVAEVAKLFADSGVVSLCSFVSPFSKVRPSP